MLDPDVIYNSRLQMSTEGAAPIIIRRLEESKKVNPEV